MKVVFVCHDAGAYGAPRSLLDLIDGLKEKSVDCYVLVPYNGPLTKELQKRNIEFKILPYVLWVYRSTSSSLEVKFKVFVKNFPGSRLRRAAKNILAIPKINAQIKAWNPDIVYTNSSTTPVGAIAAYQLGIPHIWHIREFLHLDQGLALDWGKLFFKKIANYSAKVIFISEALKNYYKISLGIKESLVVYNGVASSEDFQKAKLQKAAYRRPNKDIYTFCIVGRIDPQKGQHEAVKAIALLLQRGWKVKLIIAGSGDQAGLETLSKRLGIEKEIDIIGRTNDPFSVYLQSDACLVCSSNEGFGRVTVEAMAATIPVIGKKHDHAGTKELIKHKLTGLLYSGGESELADMMELLLKNPAWGKELGLKGWEYAKGHFNREIYVNNIFTTLQNVINK